MPLAPCLEPLGVGKLICQHLAAGRCGPALLDQPPVGIAGAIEYAFKSEGKRALVAVVLPKIADTCIGKEPSHRAAPARHEPRAALRQVAQRSGTLRRSGGFPLAVLISLCHQFKQAVGRRAAMREPSVEAHPLGASQGRRFHIVGALDNRHAQRGQCAVSRILEGREQQGVGVQGVQQFRIGLHGIARRFQPPCLYELF